MGAELVANVRLPADIVPVAPAMGRWTAGPAGTGRAGGRRADERVRGGALASAKYGGLPTARYELDSRTAMAIRLDKNQHPASCRGRSAQRRRQHVHAAHTGPARTQGDIGTKRDGGVVGQGVSFTAIAAAAPAYPWPVFVVGAASSRPTLRRPRFVSSDIGAGAGSDRGFAASGGRQVGQTYVAGIRSLFATVAGAHREPLANAGVLRGSSSIPSLFATVRVRGARSPNKYEGTQGQLKYPRARPGPSQIASGHSRYP